MKIRWLAAAAFALALTATACSDGKSAASKKETAPAPVTVATVQRTSIPLTVTAVGNVEPIESVEVKSRIDGQIVAVHVSDGQEVRRGQLLFELDRRFLQAQLKQLEAQEARDLALLANARSLEQRHAELHAKGFVSEEALTQTRTGREAAEATVEADRAAVQTARVELSYTRIDAPIGGRVGRVALKLGSTVSANDTRALVTINRMAPINVSFAVPERLLSQVQTPPGGEPLRVSVTHEGGEAAPVTGRLSFVDNAVDAQTGTIRLHATFANTDRRLWPGQFVTVTVTLAQQSDAVVVPTQALQNGPEGPYVYVIQADQTAQLRPVKLQRTEGVNAVIAEGVQPGEQVITAGQLRVTPGAKVSVRPG